MEDFLRNYGSLFISLFTLFYLFIAKIQNIKYIEKDVLEIKNKLGILEKRQVNHEGRLSRVEGRLNGRD